MSIINALRTYLSTYESLKAGAPLFVDHIGDGPTEYAIIPLPGSQIVEEYVDGSSVREYPFAFQSAESTADDLERIENSGFYEDFAAWLESQTDAEDFPTLSSGKTPEKIEALGWAFLYQQGESDTGIYQIQCKLTYIQDN